MADCNLSPKPQLGRPQLLQIAWWETVAQAVGRGMEKECPALEEWCRMLNTIDLCMLANYTEELV
jgi:hypothetical protein